MTTSNEHFKTTASKNKKTTTTTTTSPQAGTRFLKPEQVRVMLEGLEPVVP
jgi:hypothetical protein